MPSPCHLPQSGRAPAEIAAALTLALGASLPDHLQNWPVGLTIAWNEAAEDAAFARARTIGEMSKAFLAHRLARLS